MKVSIVKITPEVAKEYLEKNTDNYRKYNQRTVDKYADDMKHGLWQENGMPIVFSKDGKLADGQHRLMAIVKSGATIETLVVEDSMASFFDCHKKRTTKDTLKANGYSGYATSLTVIGAISMLLSGKYKYSDAASIGTIDKFVGKREVELDAVGSAVFTGSSTSSITRKSSVFCAAWSLFLFGESLKDLREFFAIVSTGFPSETKESSSAIVLRNMLLDSQHTHAMRVGELREVHFSATIQAYLDFKKSVKRRLSYGIRKDTGKYFEYASSMAHEDVEE